MNDLKIRNLRYSPKLLIVLSSESIFMHPQKLYL